MTPSAAEALGYERASKTSKITRFGQQNPLSLRWNIDKQLALWHSAWEDVTNRYLERIGAEARIDHRSHADRGLLEQTEAKYQAELDTVLAQFRELVEDRKTWTRQNCKISGSSCVSPALRMHGRKYSRPMETSTVRSPCWKPSRMWIICSGKTKESWHRQFKSGLSDTNRNPVKSSPSGTMKEKVSRAEKKPKIR